MSEIMWRVANHLPQNLTIDELAEAFLYAAGQEWLAPTLDSAVYASDARTKIVARRVYLRLIHYDDFPDDTRVLAVLEAIPDRWLLHSATRQFIRRWARQKRRALPQDHLDRYAAICMRLHPEGR